MSENYSTIEKEALVLLLAIQHFEVYLSSGDCIAVYTDHNLLIFLARMSNSASYDFCNPKDY